MNPIPVLLNEEYYTRYNNREVLNKDQDTEHKPHHQTPSTSSTKKMIMCTQLLMSCNSTSGCMTAVALIVASITVYRWQRKWKWKWKWRIYEEEEYMREEYQWCMNHDMDTTYNVMDMYAMDMHPMEILFNDIILNNVIMENVNQHEKELQERITISYQLHKDMYDMYEHANGIYQWKCPMLLNEESKLMLCKPFFKLPLVESIGLALNYGVHPYLKELLLSAVHLPIASIVRGRVWPEIVFRTAKISCTSMLYDSFREQGKQVYAIVKECTDAHHGFNLVGNMSSLDLLELDIDRTFVYLDVFSKGTVLRQHLINIICSFVCLRPDIGYVQGMCFIAGTLLIHMRERQAFLCFASLLQRPLLHTLFTFNSKATQFYSNLFEVLLSAKSPVVYERLVKLDIKPELIVHLWFRTLFASSLPIPLCARVWDFIFLEGDIYLYRCSIGLLNLLHNMHNNIDDEQESDGFMYDLTHVPKNLNSKLLLYYIDSQQIDKAVVLQHMKEKPSKNQSVFIDSLFVH